MMTNGPLSSSLLEGFQGSTKVQDINSTMTSTVSSSSPDGSFMNFLRQESHNSSTFCPSSPISPVIRQQNIGQPQLVRDNSSYSDDSQGLGLRGYAASPIIQHSKFSPVGTPNFSIDGRSSRSYSGDFLPPPPNLDSNLDPMRQFDKDPPFTTTPTKHGVQLGGAGNRDRSFSSPSINTRQLPIGARSPLPPSNQTLFENKVSSSWNEGPGFPSPSLYRSDNMSTPSIPTDRFSSRPPRYGVNREVSPRADNFNFPSQTSYSNQVNSMPNQNHMRSQSLGVGFSGSQGFDAFQGGISNNLNNTFNGGGINQNLSNNNANQIQSELGGFQFLNLNQEGPSYKQNNLHNRSPSLPPGLVNGSQDFSHNFNMQQGPYHAQKLQPQMPCLQRHNSTGAQHYVVNERGEIVGHATSMLHQGSNGGYVQGINYYGGPQSFRVLPQHPGFHNDGMQGPSQGVGSTGMMHQRHHTEPNLLRHSEVSDDIDQALVGENIEDIEDTDAGSRSSSRAGVVEEKTFSYASTLMKTPDAAANVKASAQLFTAGAALTKSRPKLVYNIKFKRSQRNFILSERITRDIKIGTYVKVEADRGEDLGIVFGVVPIEKFRPKQSSGEDEASQPGNISSLKRIMRVATNDEISLLEVKNDDEEELLKICRTKAHQRGLPMTVVDAEYQFDRHKLTFFFEAEGRIDFRELVRDLFSMFKTRIWMQQLDKSGVIKED